MLRYAGIGSRRTPNDILPVMQDFAYAMKHAVLRTGGAEGADMAFEFGANLSYSKREIYLPWKGFNGCLNAELHEPTEQAMQVAEHYHPGWCYLKRPARLLMGRNSHQVLGRNLDDPVEMVVCWTPDGSLDGSGGQSGGTGQALRIAADRGIEVFNLQRPEHLAWIRECIGDDGIPL